MSLFSAAFLIAKNILKRDLREIFQKNKSKTKRGGPKSRAVFHIKAIEIRVYHFIPAY
jgi:hypothetical protein